MILPLSIYSTERSGVPSGVSFCKSEVELSVNKTDYIWEDIIYSYYFGISEFKSYYENVSKVEYLLAPVLPQGTEKYWNATISPNKFIFSNEKGKAEYSDLFITINENLPKNTSFYSFQKQKELIIDTFYILYDDEGKKLGEGYFPLSKLIILIEPYYDLKITFSIKSITIVQGN